MKKLSKHILISKRRINHKAEIKRIEPINNKILKTVLQAFNQVKYNVYSDSDRVSFLQCENYRKNLLTNNTVITYEVFGTDQTALVKNICKKAASSKKWCNFLYALVKHTDKPNILEIGTNLGISGSYMLEAMKNRNGNFISMEGLPQLCEIANTQFATIVPKSEFEIIQGLYDETFPKIMKKQVPFNLVFIDGNHKKEPTIDYFNTLKSNMAQTAVFVFDDINWSDGMKEAWDIIKNDPNVNFTIDMYEQGIVIIDKNEPLRNQHFALHLSY
ncbi:MAG: O-methyltransferase [Aestuariibaculum sp.]